MTLFIDKQQVDEVLTDLQGRMVTVTVIKKNGEPRTLNGQLVASPESHNKNADLFTIALSSSSKDDKQFRTGNKTKITRIAGKGKVYAVKSQLSKYI